MGPTTIMLVIGVAIFAFGCGFIFHMVRQEHALAKVPTEGRIVQLDLRLEYDRQSGGVFYILENLGNTVAHDVRVYLPKCDSIVRSRRGRHSPVIAAAILKVMLQRLKQMPPGARIEIPLLSVPPGDDTAKEVYGLGLDVEMQWSTSQGDVTRSEFILPITSRAKRRQEDHAFA